MCEINQQGQTPRGPPVAQQLGENAYSNRDANQPTLQCTEEQAQPLSQDQVLPMALQLRRQINQTTEGV